MSDKKSLTPTRNAKGHWVKGYAPNPSGRPKGFKGFAKEIMKATRDGKELQEFLLSVLRGVTPPIMDGTVDAGGVAVPLENPPLQARMWACEQLLNRGLGRSPQVVEITSDIDSDATATAIDISELSDDELEALEKAADVLAAHQEGRKVIDV